MHIKRIFISLLLSLITLPALLPANSPFEVTKNAPAFYQGRFRALDAVAKLWLYEYYHKQALSSSDLYAFNNSESSSLDLLWKFHFLGHPPFDEAPLFWIHYAEVKSLLRLPLSKTHFSYNELAHLFYENQEINLAIMQFLLPYEFARNYQAPANRVRSDKSELTTLSPGLWTALHGEDLILLAAPRSPPWHFLAQGMKIAPSIRNRLAEITKQRKSSAEEILGLLHRMHAYAENGGAKNINAPLEHLFLSLENQGMAPKEIPLAIEARLPFKSRLQKAGSTLKMLPSRFTSGEWFSLHALKVQTYDQNLQKLVLADNFTVFSDDQFLKIREAYFTFENEALNYFLTLKDAHLLKNAALQFIAEYNQAYSSIANTPYKSASGKQLTYPSIQQLRVETLYYQLPLIEATILIYLIALLSALAAYLLKKTKISSWALYLLILGFLLHTLVLAIRCYVLQRPPVSNMFETIIYVPWIALAIGLIFYTTARSRLILWSGCCTSLSLLLLLKLTHVDANLENVQAVLDSQYWLIVHVLMVVASYGAFAVCGMLGHLYFLLLWRAKHPSGGLSEGLKGVSQGILYTMYVGVALLIPGTILGGVWAAESWGRFWDWDPKESWAFISACIYLLVIHAYTFHRIRDFGLAVGAIGGLMAISFTWYGVNYVLGTGLHSYGFGQGGEIYYYMYLGGESLFLAAAFIPKVIQNLAIRVRKNPGDKRS